MAYVKTYLAVAKPQRKSGDSIPDAVGAEEVEEYEDWLEDTFDTSTYESGVDGSDEDDTDIALGVLYRCWVLM
jgi:hypothetical protein